LARPRVDPGEERRRRRVGIESDQIDVDDLAQEPFRVALAHWHERPLRAHRVCGEGGRPLLRGEGGLQERRRQHGDDPIGALGGPIHLEREVAARAEIRPPRRATTRPSTRNGETGRRVRGPVGECSSSVPAGSRARRDARRIEPT
jgi:hypothetical protein